MNICKYKYCNNKTLYPRIYCQRDCYSKERKREVIEEKYPEIIKDYETLGTLAKVGQKYNITRERVRQILEVKSFSRHDFKKSIQDAKNLIEKRIRLDKLKVCKTCKRFYTFSNRKPTLRHTQSDICMDCFKKIRAKLNHYKAQREWQDKNKEYVLKCNRIYYWKNKERLLQYQKDHRIKKDLTKAL